MRALAAGFTITAICLGRAAFATCDGVDGVCEMDSGEYHLVLPEDPQEQSPVVVFLHGFGSNGGNVIKNSRLLDPLLERGYAVIAPNATEGEPGGRKRWTFYPGWPGRDETVFLREVVDDAAARFGTSDERVMLSGFSSGGFMVNYLACDAPDTFAAYAPVAGGFWKPHPAQCNGPVRLFHTHGWRDSTVPLEGRSLGGGRFQQGDIFAGLDIWRAANECKDEKPNSFSETGDFLRRKWTDCNPNAALELAMFPGGHTVPDGWADMALDWFEALE